MKCLVLVTNAASNTRCFCKCFCESHFIILANSVILASIIKPMDCPGQCATCTSLWAQWQESGHHRMCCAVKSFNQKPHQKHKTKKGTVEDHAMTLTSTSCNHQTPLFLHSFNPRSQPLPLGHTVTVPTSFLWVLMAQCFGTWQETGRLCVQIQQLRFCVFIKSTLSFSSFDFFNVNTQLSWCNPTIWEAEITKEMFSRHSCNCKRLKLLTVKKNLKDHPTIKTHPLSLSFVLIQHTLAGNCDSPHLSLWKLCGWHNASWFTGRSPQLLIV